MSKFIKDLSLFVAGMSLLTTKAFSAALPATLPSVSDEATPVPLRPLNRDISNMFAGHRSHSSHSSHASHSSHYSGSSGSSSPSTSSSSPSPPSSTSPKSTPSDEPAKAQGLISTPKSTETGATFSGEPSATAPPFNEYAPTASAPASKALNNSLAPVFGADLVPMTRAEKLRLQIIQIQIRLHTLELYSGQVDGVLNPGTKKALALFQKIKGLPETGQMSTATLNALNIKAVN